jgi:hypothetical protein
VRLGAFRRVHGHVRPVQQGVRSVVGAAEGDTDAGADRHGGVAQLDRSGRGGQDAFGDRARLGDVTHLVEDDGELVAAEAGCGVGLTHAALQHLGEGLQNPVAGLVAEGVVDLLEPVQIDEQHRDVFPAADGPLQAVAQAHPVGQAGETVGQHQFVVLPHRGQLPDRDRAGHHDRAGDQPAPREHGALADGSHQQQQVTAGQRQVRQMTDGGRGVRRRSDTGLGGRPPELLDRGDDHQEGAGEQAQPGGQRHHRTRMVDLLVAEEQVAGQVQRQPGQQNRQGMRQRGDAAAEQDRTDAEDDQEVPEGKAGQRQRRLDRSAVAQGGTDDEVPHHHEPAPGDRAEVQAQAVPLRRRQPVQGEHQHGSQQNRHHQQPAAGTHPARHGAALRPAGNGETDIRDDAQQPRHDHEPPRPAILGPKPPRPRHHDTQRQSGDVEQHERRPEQLHGAQPVSEQPELTEQDAGQREPQEHHQPAPARSCASPPTGSAGTGTQRGPPTVCVLAIPIGVAGGHLKPNSLPLRTAPQLQPPTCRCSSWRSHSGSRGTGRA